MFRILVVSLAVFGMMGCGFCLPFALAGGMSFWAAAFAIFPLLSGYVLIRAWDAPMGGGRGSA